MDSALKAEENERIVIKGRRKGSEKNDNSKTKKSKKEPENAVNRFFRSKSFTFPFKK